MEPPANTSPTSSTELEHLEKGQALGEAANLGCPRLETTNATKKVDESGPTKTPVKTAIPGGPAAEIPTTIPGGSTAALAAKTARGAATIETSKGKT